jgi:GntR family transcriptional regulator
VPDEKPEVPPFDPDAVTAEYVYKRLADHVVARIKAVQLPPGARLEGERAMSEAYGVALGTVRRAIRELVERGWVVVLPAKGTYVKPATEWPQD